MEQSEAGGWEVRSKTGHRGPHPAGSCTHGEAFAFILNEMGTRGGL